MTRQDVDEAIGFRVCKASGSVDVQFYMLCERSYVLCIYSISQREFSWDVISRLVLHTKSSSVLKKLNDKISF